LTVIPAPEPEFILTLPLSINSYFPLSPSLSSVLKPPLTLTPDPRPPLDFQLSTSVPLLPNVDNANYLWIQMFYSALNETGRGGFVMANSAADARHSEKEIRKQLIEDKAVDAMVSIGSNFFYTVTLPCTLWFMDRGKKDLPTVTPSPQSSPKGRGSSESPSPSGGRNKDGGPTDESPSTSGRGKKTRTSTSKPASPNWMPSSRT